MVGNRQVYLPEVGGSNVEPGPLHQSLSPHYNHKELIQTRNSEYLSWRWNSSYPYARAKPRKPLTFSKVEDELSHKKSLPYNLQDMPPWQEQKESVSHSIRSSQICSKVFNLDQMLDLENLVGFLRCFSHHRFIVVVAKLGNGDVLTI